MAIILREVSDTDIARACEIESLAYKDNPPNPILNPGPFPPGASQQRVQQIVEMRKNDSTAHYMQAFDDATGQMVAWAKWRIFETTEAAAASFKPLRFGPGMNPEACKIFFEGMAERRKAIMADRPYIYLQLLYTHPDFQGRGAGGLLLNWGKQCADKLGLPIYLASTPVGHRFYQKHGFKDVEAFRLDFTSSGGTIHEQPLMLWEPSRP